MAVKTLPNGFSTELPPAPKPIVTSQPAIIDIRSDTNGFDILEDIHRGLRPANGGEKTLPTLLLYDEQGLKLFEDITYLEEYYLTGAEIEVLQTYADRIAERIRHDTVMVELGSGNLRKIRILLDAIERAEKPIEYYALDVSYDELSRALAAVPEGTFKYVKCFGLNGTYDDGLKWLKSDHIIGRPKTVLSMGSSIGNFKRHEAVDFLKDFADTLQPGDSLIVGIDGCKNPEKVYHAYNDKHGITHNFVLNGLNQANRLLGTDAFDLSHWKVIGEFDKSAGRHHAFVTPDVDVVVDGVLIRKNERIRIEESYKWSPSEISRLFHAAGLVEGAKWSNPTAEYGLHKVYKPTFQFALAPEQYATRPVPTLTEWQQLWGAWDTVTRQMIPQEELLSKPIRLRNACIFYLGHIPTFLDIHITRATEGLPTEPAFYAKIFERGIDPDVDNPEKCHMHSEIPEEWPPFQQIADFQLRVRERVKSLYVSGEAWTDHRVKKALWIGFEHEAMHLETLLYMLVQSKKTQPPVGVFNPDFEASAYEARTRSVGNEWFHIPARTVTLGLEDNDKDTVSERYFGWDNEKPVRKVKVGEFKAKGRPITNGEYASYMERKGITKTPASWTEVDKMADVTNGANGCHGNAVDGYPYRASKSTFLEGKAVRTVFGAVPLKLTLEWPVMASYDELAGCAKWMGGRIPTLEEVKSIYEYVEELKADQFENSLAKTIPAVNSHLVNDGVEETPPSGNSTNGAAGAAAGPSPHSLFVNLQNANVAFKHWHPVAVSPNGNRLAGQGDMGGVWEWTSSVLTRHDGFEPMELYPLYTADFMDGKHNIVLGGSWATHPRIAGRKSFVNWYQRNYPYVWAGARLVHDV